MYLEACCLGAAYLFLVPHACSGRVRGAACVDHSDNRQQKPSEHPRVGCLGTLGTANLSQHHATSTDSTHSYTRAVHWGVLHGGLPTTPSPEATNTAGPCPTSAQPTQVSALLLLITFLHCVCMLATYDGLPCAFVEHGLFTSRTLHI